MPNYTDLASLRAAGEDLPSGDVVETTDFTGRALAPVGSYISQARSISNIKRRDDGHFVFQIDFTGGLINPESGRTFFTGQYPLRTWITTIPMAQEGVVGKTSRVAEYLKACEFKIKGRSFAEILDLMEESLAAPVGVYVGLTDKGVKQDDGTYKSANLKTRDFNIGTKEAPVYVPQIEKDGVLYTAQEKVQNFKRVSSVTN